MKRVSILIALLLVNITSFAEEQTRCGRFQGKVIKIEQSYIFGWPDYVGSSVWDADKFKKGLQMGCEDPFRSLAMIVHWPEMTPNGGLDYKPSTHNIVIVLSAVVKDTGLSRMVKEVFFRDAKLETKEQVQEQVRLDPETGLWKLEIKDPIEKIRFGNHYDAYWSYKGNDAVSRYIRCNSYKRDVVLNDCDLTIYLKEYKAVLSIKFTRNLLPQWPELERQALAFIRSKTIH